MIANQVAGLFAGGVPPIVLGDYESIQTVNGTGSSGTISFTSIPSTYKHLQIRVVAQYSTASETGARIRLNSDTGSNYAYHELYGTGSGAGAAGYSSQTYMGDMVYVTAINSSIGGAVIDILDYANTNKYKTVRSLCGGDNNGSGYVQLVSGLWQNTSAISNIEIYIAANSFTTGSKFALYGVK